MRHKLLTPLLFFFSIMLALGQTLDTELLELNFSANGYPERFTKADNGFYFTVDDNELWFTDGTVEGTYLLATPTPANEIILIHPVNNMVFFTVGKDYRTHELWVTDGSETGTIQLTDRNLTIDQSRPIREATVLSDKIYFSTFDEALGVELWVSDGTLEGTTILKDIYEGAESSNPSNFYVFEGNLFFNAYTEEYGTELWKTDGTTEGTQLFKDIDPNDVSSFNNSEGYARLGNNFYFFADNGETGSELWKSDGTPEGTMLFKDIFQGSSYTPSGYVMQGGEINGKLLFLANDGIHGEELWETDGTPEGTVLFKDILEGSNSAFGFNRKEFAFSNDKLIFYLDDFVNENVGLWVSDGTPEGTQFIKQIYASNLTYDNTGEYIYFFGDESSPNDKKALWKSDGTSAGTRMISAKATATITSAHENDMIIVDEQIFYPGETEQNGIELWTSDGTDAGTFLFKDFNTTGGVNLSLLTAVGDQLFFRGGNGLGASDGTVEGTKYLGTDLGGLIISGDSEFIDFNGRLAVSANDGVHGFELWISDGTPHGTYMIKDINPGSASSMYNEVYFKTLTVINNRLYFIADDGVYGAELWTSDGTEAGTYRVTDIAQGIGNHFGSYPNNLVWFNDAIYFSASDGTGSALYKTDGTPSGTDKIIGLHDLSSIKVVNNRLVMVANDPENSYGPNQIWFSDGTADGTYFFDSYGGGIDSGIQDLTTLDDELYFVAFYPNDGYDPNPEFYGKSVFKTDGTPEGTAALFIGSEHSFSNLDIDVLLTCGDYVYFVIEGSSYDFELWRTDGTVEGTIPIVTDEGVFNSINELNCFKNNLIFAQYAKPEPIWLTTGKPDEVYGFDINVVNSPSSPSSINYPTAAGNKLFFSATTSLNGSEIYVTSLKNFVADNDLTDNDNDGVIDIFDECPDTSIGEEINDVGCAQSQLDDDNDGVTNDLDECPETAPDEVVDSKGCSTADLLDSDNDGITDPLDLCPNTPIGESVDAKGCSPSQLDDDNDGIMNNADLCPETLHTQEVDANGCPVFFDLPSDNFSLETIGVTCVDKNNGQIIISAVENYNYVATTYNGSYNFTSELTIPDLRPREYELCITIPEEPDFMRCFKFEIADAMEITGKSNTTISNKKILETIELSSGTAPFTVSVNGKEEMITMSSEFSIEVDYGDEVAVTSKHPCEGVYEKKIEGGHKIIFAPNPADYFIDVYLSEYKASEVEVRVFNTNLQLVKSVNEDLESGKLRVSLEGLPSGIYYIELGTADKKVFKIVKR